MRVVIITLSGYWNYGNRLQNYALKVVLEKKFGINVSTAQTWQSQKKIGGINGFYDFLKKIKNHRIFKSMALGTREKVFKQFSIKMLNETEDIIDVNDSKATLNTFDKVIVGSDQVWNTTWLNNSQVRFFLLENVLPEKRISYAASIGVNFIEDKYKSLFQYELKNFRAVSVREETASAILQDLTEKIYPVVLDPTMLLTKQEWTNEIKNINSLGEDYVFEYFLGRKTKKVKSMLKNIENDFDNVIAFNEYSLRSKENFTLGPLEFVKGISEAKLVVTDSFHAAVFALIFNKPLFVVDRIDNNPQMSSRMDTLFQNVNQVKKTIFDYDLQYVNSFEPKSLDIAKLYRESMDFLEKALN